MRGACVRLATIALSIATQLACNSLLGLGDYRVSAGIAKTGETEAGATEDGADPGGSACGGFEYANESCGRCMRAKCCSALNGCGADPGCRGLSQCDFRCGPSDAACRASCATEYYGSTLYSEERAEIAACRTTACAADCNQRCGADYFVPACSECLSQQCCSEQASLSDSVEGAVYAGCMLHYPQGPALCGTPSESVKAKWDAFAACRGTCAATCDPLQAPPDWSCLGNVVWPPIPLERDKIALRFGVTNFSFTKGLGDIDVQACATGFADCAALAHQATDASGFASFDVPLMPDATGLQRATFFEILHDLTGNLQEMLVFEYPQQMHSPAFGGSPLYPMGSIAALNPGLAKEHVHIFVKSCGGLRGEGVVFSTPNGLPQTTAFYAADATGSPTPGQTETTALGIGGLLDVPVGRMTVEARLKDGGQLIARVPVSVRAGLMTLLILAPGPS